MDYPAFRQSLSHSTPPDAVDRALEGLWWDAKGDWQRAHECAQDQDDRRGAWVHAYLHRKEGDAANASYWYRRTGIVAPDLSLPEEWEAIARALLAEGPSA